MTPAIRYAVEGWTDEAVAEKLLNAVNLMPYATNVTARGKSNLDKRLPDLNRSSSSLLWLVIRDLDRDDKTCVFLTCAPGFWEARPIKGCAFASRSAPSRLG